MSRITAILNHVMRKINDDYTVICDSESYCDYDDMTIAYYDGKRTYLDVFFYDYVYKNFHDIPQVSPLFLSFLHEVGHAQTEDETIDDTKNRNDFNRKDGQDDESFLQGVLAYYQLHNEQLATNWAVDFLRDNSRECMKWNKMIDRYLA